MRNFSLVGLLAVGLIAAGLPQEEKKDQDVIQGTWKLVDGERDGQKPPPPEFLNNFKITFKGDKAIPEGGKSQGDATFKLETNKKPRQIHITRLEDSKVMKGIYELSGDDLKICFSRDETAEPPTEFSGKGGTGNMLMLFKRQK